MKADYGFQMNRNVLKRGIYINRINEDITTYDIRMKEPNRGDYLTNSAMHTTEHIFGTYVRNTEFGDNIIYFGAMGNRTGFYLLTRNLSDKYVINLIREGFQHVAEFWGRIPNASPKECSDCLELNLPQAKEEAKEFLKVIENWTKDDLKYPVPENEE